MQSATQTSPSKCWPLGQAGGPAPHQLLAEVGAVQALGSFMQPPYPSGIIGEVQVVEATQDVPFQVMPAVQLSAPPDTGSRLPFASQ